MVNHLQKQEETNNQYFIKAYGLSDQLDPEVELNEITLICNPHYRYSSNKSEEELEILLLAATMKEFISYAVGCMLGRYSLDKEGLILANVGETLEDYLSQVPEPNFMPDEDNVIPVLEGEWFEDDIAERFKDFLKVTFGEENFDENLAFLEEAIGRDIRGYFVKDFYDEHIKMYKKRPIYWLFSSPNGSFNALIYMHRYSPDTASVILNEYLVPYRDKLKAHKALLETRVISPDASQGEMTRASREIDQINKILSELKEYEDEILYPLATQQIKIDLDDGVLVNYNKFGKALKNVTGLSGKA
jgi:type II restriction/modification system DNA methylase subunit YeeA